MSPPATAPRSTAKATDKPDCADKLKVLADPTRLAILRALMRGPSHVGELNESIQIDQPLLSHHLRVLREAELVRSERDGKAVLYTLAPGVRIRSPKKGIQLGCCVLSFD